MSNPDEEISKEKNVESNRDLDRGDIKSISLYLLRSFGFALLLCGGIIVILLVGFTGDAPSLGDLLFAVFILLLGAVVGPFMAAIYLSGYDFLYFLGVVTLGMVLFGVGCRFWKRWWGRFLGVAGIFLWLWAGLISFSQHA